MSVGEWGHRMCGGNRGKSRGGGGLDALKVSSLSPEPAFSETTPSPPLTHLQHLVHFGSEPIEVLLGQQLALGLRHSASGFLHQSARLPLTMHLHRRGGEGGGGDALRPPRLYIRARVIFADLAPQPVQCLTVHSFLTASLEAAPPPCLLAPPSHLHSHQLYSQQLLGSFIRERPAPPPAS